MRTCIPSTFIYVCSSSLLLLTVVSSHVDVVTCGNRVTIMLHVTVDREVLQHIIYTYVALARELNIYRYTIIYIYMHNAIYMYD